MKAQSIDKPVIRIIIKGSLYRLYLFVTGSRLIYKKTFEQKDCQLVDL